MTLLLMTFLLFFAFLFLFKQKKVCNLLTFNFFYWFIIIFLSSLHLFDMMDISSNVYFLLFLGFLGILFGYIFGYYFLHKGKIKKNNNYSFVFNDKTICIMSCFNILFYLFESYRVFSLFSSGFSYYYVRRIYQGYESMSFFKSSIESYISSYVSIPIAYILSIYLVISLFSQKKNLKSILLSSLAILLYTFVSANRVLFIQMLICAVYLFYFLGKKIPKKIKNNVIKVSVFLIVSVFTVSFLKENRVNGHFYDWGVLKSLYSYFSISVPLFDYWSSYINDVGFYSYGVAFFRAPLNILNLLILKPLHLEFPLLMDTINYINATDTFIRVFPRHDYNVFTSMFYYFYMDFRHFGIFLGSFFWGAFCGNTYYNSVFRKDDKSIYILVLCIYALIKTMVRWEFSSPSYFMCFIYIYFLFKRKELNHEN